MHKIDQKKKKKKKLRFYNQTSLKKIRKKLQKNLHLDNVEEEETKILKKEAAIYLSKIYLTPYLEETNANTLLDEKETPTGKSQEAKTPQKAVPDQNLLMPGRTLQQVDNFDTIIPEIGVQVPSTASFAEPHKCVNLSMFEPDELRGFSFF